MAVAHQERPAYPFDGDPRLQEEVYSAVQGSDERKEERIRTAGLGGYSGEAFGRFLLGEFNFLLL
jgi:hypothetical protein